MHSKACAEYSCASCSEIGIKAIRLATQSFNCCPHKTQRKNMKNKQPSRGALAAPWGIDVSHHQGIVDWMRVKAAGAEFAFLKASEGTTFVDRQYKRNYARAKAAG